jgi:hypothetical protein
MILVYSTSIWMPPMTAAAALYSHVPISARVAL